MPECSYISHSNMRVDSLCKFWSSSKLWPVCHGLIFFIISWMVRVPHFSLMWLKVVPSHNFQNVLALAMESSNGVSISSWFQGNSKLTYCCARTMNHVVVHVPWSLYDYILGIHKMIFVVCYLYKKLLPWDELSLLGLTPLEILFQNPFPFIMLETFYQLACVFTPWVILVTNHQKMTM